MDQSWRNPWNNSRILLLLGLGVVTSVGISHVGGGIKIRETVPPRTDVAKMFLYLLFWAFARIGIIIACDLSPLSNPTLPSVEALINWFYLSFGFIYMTNLLALSFCTTLGGDRVQLIGLSLYWIMDTLIVTTMMLTVLWEDR